MGNVWCDGGTPAQDDMFELDGSSVLVGKLPLVKRVILFTSLFSTHHLDIDFPTNQRRLSPLHDAEANDLSALADLWR